MPEPQENVAPLPLLAALQRCVAGAGLRQQAPALVPEIPLWLIDDILPQQPLAQSEINVLMDEPPYWSFCWGSGQVLARWLLDHPEWVAGQTVLDVGPGSGVVAIAAARAGAARVLACDLDPVALLAVQANAALNGVTVECGTDLSRLLPQAQRITAADILYDRDNLPLLSQLAAQAPVRLADSRVRNFDQPGYILFDQGEATTWPDLSESSEFNCVRLYRTVASDVCTDVCTDLEPEHDA